MDNLDKEKEYYPYYSCTEMSNALLLIVSRWEQGKFECESDLSTSGE